MKKIELLSPVGDFECLKAAVQNGADSVYFGASNFNARASATNFDLSALKDAISYAKLRGVNTHLTLNTLVKDNEFEDACILAKKAYEFGIDAIIVQDLGLARYLIKNYPDLPIHASTQMTIHNLDGALKAQELGFKRVVLSRELTLEEIEYICANTDLEIETFIHGALCISYSGQCLFSSMVGGRSGNRGKCAQPCRLPYEFIAKDNEDKTSDVLSRGYLLSTRDLCGLEYLPKLIEAGVMCFKIEGRMKSPEYVATVTKIYRKYIDLALSNKPYKIDNNDVKELLQVFNRGNFSTGHFDSKANKNLVYPEKQNNMGIYIGNVSNVKPGKGHVMLNLKENLSIGDTIQFEKETTKYTVSELMIDNKNIPIAHKGDDVEIGRMKGNINIGNKVFKIASKELSTEAKNSYKTENIKIPLSASISLKKNQPIELTVSTLKSDNPLFDGISYSQNSDTLLLEAKNKPITKEKVIEQLTKTSDTIFDFKKIEVDLDNNVFVPSIKELNELRRNALEEILLTAQEKILRTTSKKIKDFELPDKKNEYKDNRKISVLLNVLNLDFDYKKLKNVDNIYIPLKYFSNKKYSNTISDISNKFNVYIYLPTIIKAKYKNLLDLAIDKSIDEFNIKGFVISNLGNAIYIQELLNQRSNKFKFIGNYTLNIYNYNSVKEYKDLKLTKLTISPELDSPTIKSICDYSVLPQELIVYGRTPLMTTRYCLIGKSNKCYPTCEAFCKDSNKSFYLKDRLGLAFPVIPDNTQTVSTIYNSKITSICGEDFNVSSYRIDIIDETIDEINEIINTAINGSRLEGKEYTNGNLNREI